MPLEIFEALVVSVEHEVAAFDRSLQAGCACVGTPLVEMPVRKSCVMAASDSTPPSVDAEGFGRRPAGSVPLDIFAAFVVSVVAEVASPETSEAAGCDACGTPPVDIESMKLCDTAARDWVPPRVDDEGFGSRAAGRVPLPIFAAFVVSVVALGAKETLFVLRHINALDAEVLQSPLASEAVNGFPPRTIPVRALPVPVPPRAVAVVPLPKSDALPDVAIAAKPEISLDAGCALVTVPSVPICVTN